MLQPQGGIVKCPPDGKNSFLSLLQDEMTGDHYIVTRGIPEVIDLMTEIAEQSSAKRKAEAKELAAVDQAKKPRHGSSAAKILVKTWLDSPKSKKLFLSNSANE
jgi:hypothetical protein